MFSHFSFGCPQNLAAYSQSCENISFGLSKICEKVRKFLVQKYIFDHYMKKDIGKT